MRKAAKEPRENESINHRVLQFQVLEEEVSETGKDENVQTKKCRSRPPKRIYSENSFSHDVFPLQTILMNSGMKT